MKDKKQDLIDQQLQDFNDDGVDRRGFLKCMAWAGTGLVWTQIWLGVELIESTKPRSRVCRLPLISGADPFDSPKSEAEPISPPLLAAAFNSPGIEPRSRVLSSRGRIGQH